jgi:hypothetical protein
MEAAMIWLRWYVLVCALTFLDCVLIVQQQYLIAAGALIVTFYVLWRGRIG